MTSNQILPLASPMKVETMFATESLDAKTEFKSLALISKEKKEIPLSSAAAKESNLLEASLLGEFSEEDLGIDISLYSTNILTKVVEYLAYLSLHAETKKKFSSIHKSIKYASIEDLVSPEMKLTSQESEWLNVYLKSIPTVGDLMELLACANYLDVPSLLLLLSSFLASLTTNVGSLMLPQVWKWNLSLEDAKQLQHKYKDCDFEVRKDSIQKEFRYQFDQKDSRLSKIISNGNEKFSYVLISNGIYIGTCHLLDSVETLISLAVTTLNDSFVGESTTFQIQTSNTDVIMMSQTPPVFWGLITTLTPEIKESKDLFAYFRRQCASAAVLIQKYGNDAIAGIRLANVEFPEINTNLTLRQNFSLQALLTHPSFNMDLFSVMLPYLAPKVNLNLTHLIHKQISLERRIRVIHVICNRYIVQLSNNLVAIDTSNYRESIELSNSYFNSAISQMTSTNGIYNYVQNIFGLGRSPLLPEGKYDFLKHPNDVYHDLNSLTALLSIGDYTYYSRQLSDDYTYLCWWNLSHLHESQDKKINISGHLIIKKPQNEIYRYIMHHTYVGVIKTSESELTINLTSLQPYEKNLETIKELKIDQETRISLTDPYLNKLENYGRYLYIRSQQRSFNIYDPFTQTLLFDNFPGYVNYGYQGGSISSEDLIMFPLDHKLYIIDGHTSTEEKANVKIKTIPVNKTESIQTVASNQYYLIYRHIGVYGESEPNGFSELYSVSLKTREILRLPDIRGCQNFFLDNDRLIISTANITTSSTILINCGTTEMKTLTKYIQNESTQFNPKENFPSYELNSLYLVQDKFVRFTNTDFDVYI